MSEDTTKLTPRASAVDYITKMISDSDVRTKLFRAMPRDMDESDCAAVTSIVRKTTNDAESVPQVVAYFSAPQTSPRRAAPPAKVKPTAPRALGVAIMGSTGRKFSR